jgi:hypothetical protein
MNGRRKRVYVSCLVVLAAIGVLGGLATIVPVMGLILWLAGWIGVLLAARMGLTKRAALVSLICGYEAGVVAETWLFVTDPSAGGLNRSFSGAFITWRVGFAGLGLVVLVAGWRRVDRGQS